MGDQNDAIGQAVELARREIPPYVEVLLYEIREKQGYFGVASAVYVQVGERIVAVTCEHVVAKAARVWIGVPRLARPQVPDDTSNLLTDPPATALESNGLADLAIIEAKDIRLQEHGKRPYLFSDSSWITRDSLQRNVGTLSFVYGVWGDKTTMIPYPDGINFAETPIAFLCGPIHLMDESLVVGDYTNRNVQINTDAFPAIQEESPPPKSRDLKGTSGAGLWINRDGKMNLAGILCGPYPCPVNQQLIKFTPVWVLREWLVRVGFRA